jgi:hypothetical protein
VRSHADQARTRLSEHPDVATSAVYRNRCQAEQQARADGMNFAGYRKLQWAAAQPARSAMHACTVCVNPVDTAA